MIKHFIKDGVAVVTLSREKGLNALHPDMLDEIFKIYREIEKNDEVKIVVLNSDRENFCAGGDLKSVYENFKVCHDDSCIMSYFKKEYDLDIYLKDVKKPTITFWNGITMGGGVGLSLHSEIIIADETVKWAMPETKIGIVPDVGVGTIFSKMDRPLANYLSLNGKTISGSDTVRLNIADFLIDSKNREKILEILFNISNKNKNKNADEILKEFRDVLKDYSEPLKKTELGFLEENIEMHYNQDSLKAIFNSLELSSDEEFSKKSLEELKSFSPYSLMLQFEKIKAGKSWDIIETLKRDFMYILDAVANGDFEEGIRALMIDKDNSPKWTFNSIDEVDKDRINYVLYERETNYPE